MNTSSRRDTLAEAQYHEETEHGCSICRLRDDGKANPHYFVSPGYFVAPWPCAVVELARLQAKLAVLTAEEGR
jgi:hypothetical protein